MIPPFSDWGLLPLLLGCGCLFFGNKKTPLWALAAFAAISTSSQLDPKLGKRFGVIHIIIIENVLVLAYDFGFFRYVYFN